MFLHKLDGLQTIRCDGNHLQIVYGCQHQARIAARFLNVVGDEHPHFPVLGFFGLRHFKLPFSRAFCNL
jgi:hypothetical protein